MSKTKIWTKDFILITLINFFLFFAFQLFPSAMPPYLKSLGADDFILGLLQGVLTAATLLIRPFAGYALDRYGRKGIFIIGTIGMILSTLAYRFFPIVGVIFVIRFLHGLSWGIANTACSTVATDNIEKKYFAEGMGYFSLASSIAMAIAPAVALKLNIQNVISLALLFLGVTLVMTLIIQYKQQPKSENSNRKTMSLYAKESILPSVIMLLIMITFGAILTFLALYSRQKGIENIGLFFTVYAVSMLISRPFLGKLLDKKGYGVGVWAGVVLIPIAMVLLSISSNFSFFMLCAVIYGVGIGAAQASLQAMAIVNVPSHRTGAANATFFTGFDGGIGLGAVLAGSLSGILGYGGMFALMSIFPLLAGAIYFVSVKRKKT